MLRLFFLEIPLSILVALVAAYSSYIVTIGVVSNILNFPSIINWGFSAIVLVATLCFLSNWTLFHKTIIFKKYVLKYLPSLSAAVGVLVLVAGIIQ